MSSDKRRSGPRLDLRLRVKFLSDERMPEAEATDISPGGARLECRVPIEPGARIDVALDAGDGEPVKTEATVAWCRQRKTMSLRKLYDVGVRFESEWLSGRRGKLGKALGRIFAFSECEPARAYDRVPVTLRARSLGDTELSLTVVDLSEGGMQLRSDSGLGTAVKTGATVIVEVPNGDTVSIDGEIVWVVQQEEGDDAILASFGVRFVDLGEKELGVVQAIKDGRVVPPSLSLFLPG